MEYSRRINFRHQVNEEWIEDVLRAYICRYVKLIYSKPIVKLSKNFQPVEGTQRLTSSIIVESNRFDPVQKGRANPGLAGVEWKNNEYLEIDELRDRGVNQVDDHNSPRRCPSTLQSFVSIFQGRFPTRKRFEPFKSYVCFGTCAPSLSRPPAAPLLPPAAISTLHPGNRQYLVPPTHPPDRWWLGERAPFWGLWCVQMAVHREITRGCAQLHGCTEYMPDHRRNVRPTNTN